MAHFKTDVNVYNGLHDLMLTPYINDAREIWLASEGNGCGDDVMVEGIDGWSNYEVLSNYANINPTKMIHAAKQFAAAGMVEEAEWLRLWCYRLDNVLRGEVVDSDEFDDVMHELKSNQTDIDTETISDMRVICRHGDAVLYRAMDGAVDVYIITSAGTPSVYLYLDLAWNDFIY